MKTGKLRQEARQEATQAAPEGPSRTSSTEGAEPMPKKTEGTPVSFREATAMGKRKQSPGKPRKITSSMMRAKNGQLWSRRQRRVHGRGWGELLFP